MSEARKLAVEYRRTTGKPLPGISGEIANYDAARLLDLELVKDNAPGGYDAIGKGKREGRRVQVKGRAILDEKKSGQRIGQLKLEQDWDSVVLVLMDDTVMLEKLLDFHVAKPKWFDFARDKQARGTLSIL